jgi:hypothetical protein
MTPERREELKMKVERSRMAEASRRKCKAVKSHAMRSKALVSEGLRQMSCASAPEEFSMVQARWTAAQEVSEARSMKAFSKVDEDVVETAIARVENFEEEDDEEAASMMECAALIGASAPSDLARPASAQGAEDEFRRLLDQLRVEPSDDSELAAKFGLYEAYGQQVEKMRSTLFGIYEENKPTLPDAVKNDMEKQLKRIDRADAMGIFDEAREWFVYLMMSKAGENNDGMSSIMESFEKRLEFLAANDQDECPICLEKFSESLPADTLGCCHKVCHDCWTQWCAVTHGHPFCPLCKNDEFVEALHTRVST